MTVEAGVLALRVAEQGAEEVERKLTDIDKLGKKIASTPINVPIKAPDLTLIDRQLEQLSKQVTLFQQGSKFASTKAGSLRELGQAEQQLKEIVGRSNTWLEQRIKA